MKKKYEFKSIPNMLITFVLLFMIFPLTIHSQRTAEIGAQQNFETDPTYWMRTSKLDETHFIVIYKSDLSPSASASDIYAVVGEVDPDTKTISYGTPTVVEEANANRAFVIGISATQAVVGYEHDLTTDIGKARVVTISGTSITGIGDLYTFSEGDYTTISAIHAGSGKIVIVYDDLENGSFGTIVAGDVSGDQITFGTPQVFSASHTDRPAVNKISSTKIILGFEDDGSTYDHGKVIIADLSGTTFTFGDAATFHSNNTASAVKEVSVAPLSSGYFVVAYTKDDDGDKGYAIIGTYSGTDASFPGSGVMFEDSYLVIDKDVEQLNEDEFLLAWNGSSTANPSHIIVGVRNGNSIDFGPQIEYNATQGDDNRLVVLTADTFVLAFTDDAVEPKDQGDAIVGTLTPAVAPVELTSFYAAIQNNSVTLNWETATEINNYGFDIERKVVSSQNSDLPAGEGFTTIGFVPGHGNSNSPKQYEFVDSDLPSDSLEYRLKQIDTDGAYKYYYLSEKVGGTLTGIDDESLSTEYSLEQNYPNPFNPTTVIEYSIPIVGDAKLASSKTTKLVVYDMLGREVAVLVNTQQSAGRYSIEFNAAHLSSGMYVYRLTSGNFVSTKKLLLMK